MSFGQNVTATKIELFKYKRSSQVATMVQKILDDKRKVLLKNIEEMIAEAQKTRGGIWEPLQDIYQSVNESYLSLGVGTVDSVAQSTPAVMEVESDVKRVVDVTIPVLSVTEKDTKPIPAPIAARPNARPAPISFEPSPLPEEAPSSAACATPVSPVNETAMTASKNIESGLIFNF